MLVPSQQRQKKQDKRVRSSAKEGLEPEMLQFYCSGVKFYVLGNSKTQIEAHSSDNMASGDKSLGQLFILQS